MAKRVYPGDVFEYWTVVSRVDMNHWLCRCRCGIEKSIQTGRLRNGDSKSCGCRPNVRGTKHGLAATSTYKIWQGIIQRCENRRSRAYKWYGKRGITVCAAWHKFENFLADMGMRPDGRSIDRIDNDGNYCKDNCRWATKTEQVANYGRSKLVTFNGKTQPIGVWSRELGIPQQTLYYRYAHGWPPEKLLTK